VTQVEAVEQVKSLARRFFLQSLCIASSISFVASILAEQGNPEGLRDWFLSGEYVAEETYVGSGDVQRNPRKSVRDFDEHDSILHFVLTPRIKPGVLRLGVEWERFSFGLPDGAPLPDMLQAVNLVIGLDTQLSDSILIRVEAQPGVYNTGFHDLSDDFNAPFVAGGTYIYSPNLQIVLGVSVDVERKYPVIPAAGIRWKMAPRWVLNAVLPTPRLEFEMNGGLTLYAGANLKQANYRVDDNFGDNTGNARLNHAVLTYTEVRTGAGIDWKISPVVTLTGEVGYQPYREFDFYRADVRYHQDGGAPYGMLSLHGAF
jgi:opacity protein-like surface antigen